MIRLFCTHLKTQAKRKKEKKEKIERLNIRLFVSPGDHVKKEREGKREREKKCRE